MVKEYFDFFGNKLKVGQVVAHVVMGWSTPRTVLKTIDKIDEKGVSVAWFEYKRLYRSRIKRPDRLFIKPGQYSYSDIETIGRSYADQTGECELIALRKSLEEFHNEQAS